MDFTRPYAALLFDMDGTVLTSIAVVERIWTAWALGHGLDPAALLPTIHGVRARDTIVTLNLPGIDPDAEAAKLNEMELAATDGIFAIPGAVDFLRALPPDRWAIVTSATPDLALKRLAITGIPTPPLLVTAADVAQGKPHPAGYRLAAQRLGVAPEDCLVLEDAPAGIAAGEAAGADVLVVTATHGHPMDTPHPTVADYTTLVVDILDDPARPIRLNRG
jgi:sugar-phosphatase